MNAENWRPWCHLASFFSGGVSVVIEPAQALEAGPGHTLPVAGAFAMPTRINMRLMRRRAHRRRCDGDTDSRHRVDLMIDRSTRSVDHSTGRH